MVLSIQMLLLFVGQLCAQVTFEATVSKSKMGVDDRFLLEIRLTLKGASSSLEVGELFPPAYKSFYLVGGPATGRSFSMTNGYKVISQTYSYALKPRKNGVFQIEPAVISVGDKKYQTKPVKIEVGASFATENPLKNEVTRDVFLRARLSNSKPYVGEQVILTYELYFAKNIEALNEQEISEFQGLWSQEVERPKQYAPTKVEYKGRSFSKIILKQLVLIPQKVGVRTITPLVVSTKVSIPTEKTNFWMERVYETYDLTLKSRSFKLRVQPLPERGKPDDFSGAVGRYSFTAKLDKSKVKVHKSVRLSVEIQGKGNIGLFDIPKPKLPSLVEQYTPKINSEVKASKYGLKGKVLAEYIFVPRATGSFDIEDLAFTYFDPKAGKYKTVRGKSDRIEVYGDASAQHKGGGYTKSYAPEFQGEQQGSVEKKKVEYITRDILYIKKEAKIEVIDEERSSIFQSIGFYLLLFIPPAILLLLRWKLAQMLRTLSLRRKPKRSAGQAFLSLKRAQKKYSDADPSGYYEELQRLIYRYLSVRFGIQNHELTEFRVNEKLREGGVSEALTQQLHAVLEQIDLARFASYGAVEKDKLHKEVYRLITDFSTFGRGF